LCCRAAASTVELLACCALEEGEGASATAAEEADICGVRLESLSRSA
jgi:hypothetical protein